MLRLDVTSGNASCACKRRAVSLATSPTLAPLRVLTPPRVLESALAATFAMAPAAPAQIAMPIAPAPLAAFEGQQLSRQFWTEGCAAGDLDRDGNVDLVAGPFWWRGPDFATRHEIRAPQPFPIDGYSDSFLVFVEDVDRDGWLDVVDVGFPGTAATWYRNPRRTGPHWAAHPVWSEVGVESPALVDLDGDGARELVCATQGYLLWLAPDPQRPTTPWRPHLISPLPFFGRFTHGLGTGDVNGDGRPDVVTAIGWFEQPPSLQGDPPWTPHAQRFGGGPGGGQMLIHDVDGDGDADVVASIHAHGYGLSWFEQVRIGGGIAFVEQVIQKPVPDPGDPHQFTQPHALAAADVDGDGLVDFVTGKRFWAHNGNDPGARDPAVLYWFRLLRQGGVRFVPHLVDGDSGVGLQVLAQDLNGDGRTDLASANKKGVHVFLRQR